MIAAIVIFLMGLIKGFPTLIFIVISIALGTVGFVIWYNANKALVKAQGGISTAKMDTDIEGHSMIRGGTDDYALTLPIVLEVGKSLSTVIRKEKQGSTFVEDMVPKMRLALYQDLGVRFPEYTYVLILLF